jgi:hypothetical protein
MDFLRLPLSPSKFGLNCNCGSNRMSCLNCGFFKISCKSISFKEWRLIGGSGGIACDDVDGGFVDVEDDDDAVAEFVLPKRF